jgi:hypothetical protein
MTRYFFDIGSSMGSVEYDYKGRVLPTLDHAQQMAELIAMDLGCTRPDLSSNTEVQIRGARWTLLATVPVRAVETLAA